VLVILIGPWAFSRVLSPWRQVTVFCSTDTIAPPSANSHIQVASYNIAHGRGLVNSNWDGGSHQDRMQRLDSIAELLRTIDADVVVLNEVDFDSSWSHSVNQAEYLANKAGYPYRIEQRNFDFRLLFWTWRFGNAVLSRYPITDATVIDLPGYSLWESALAGKKRSLNCEIDLGEQSVRVIAAHLSHRSEPLRIRSAAMVAEIAADSSLPTIIAGDLNSTPPGFPQCVTDTNGNNAIQLLDSCQHFQRMPIDPPEDDSLYTYDSANPVSVIDWLLIPQDWQFTGYHVEQSELSDHRPIWATIAFGVPSATPDISSLNAAP
jgi:endonuclease/exonuclease/phosphatase family metal-dependent hydrolase